MFKCKINLDAVENWQNDLLEDHTLTLYNDRREDLELMEQLDKEIAEEEAMLVANQERLRLRQIAVSSAEENGRKEIQSINAEMEAIKNETEDLKTRFQAASQEFRWNGPNFAAHFKTNYASNPGRVLCPEGKICASIHRDEEECNYWDCPALISILSRPNDSVAAHPGPTSNGIIASSTSVIIHNGNGATTVTN